MLFFFLLPLALAVPIDVILSTKPTFYLQEGERCQRTSQCASNLVCSQSNFLSFHRCHPPSALEETKNMKQRMKMLEEFSGDSATGILKAERGLERDFSTGLENIQFVNNDD